MAGAMDFRAITVEDVCVAGTPSRGLYPLQPRLPVQTPTAACVVSLGSFGYNAVLRFDPSRAIHAAFVAWVDAIEGEVRRQFFSAPGRPVLDWTSSIKDYSATRTLYLGFDDKTLVYTPGGQSLLEQSPTTLKAAACLVEIAGVWTGPTHAGLRWKVVQVLAQDPPGAAWAFAEDDEHAAVMPVRSSPACPPAPRPTPAFAFLDDA